MTGRPLLFAAVALGAAVALLLGAWPSPLDPVLRAVAGFDAGAMAFILSTLWSMRRADASRLRADAARQDEGRGVILGLVVVSCTASLAAVAAGMNPASRPHGPVEVLKVGFAGGSVAVSWFLVQLVFALHYAHEFYGDAPGGPRGGLAFPGTETPDYWDFLHFSIVLGAASQTADVSFTQGRMRRIGTLHTLVAFVFNTAVLALAINLMAALITS